MVEFDFTPLDMTNLNEEMERIEAENAKIFEHDPDLNIITLNIAYPYEINLDRITTKGPLVGWV